jgi:hypothetical protein
MKPISIIINHNILNLINNFKVSHYIIKIIIRLDRVFIINTIIHLRNNSPKEYWFNNNLCKLHCYTISQKAITFTIMHKMLMSYNRLEQLSLPRPNMDQLEVEDSLSICHHLLLYQHKICFSKMHQQCSNKTKCSIKDCSHQISSLILNLQGAIIIVALTRFPMRIQWMLIKVFLPSRTNYQYAITEEGHHNQ